MLSDVQKAMLKELTGVSDFTKGAFNIRANGASAGRQSTDNIRIDGGFFSIMASGSYDIPKDNLDFSAQVSFTKNDGFFATLATPITWPFANLSKMLFDFKIFGSLENPEWKYNKSLMDRLK